MKKFRTIWMALCTMAAVFSFTSCDEDVSLSVNLSGEWYGDFGMFYDYQVGDRVFTFNSYDTRIVFYPDYDYATYGYGKQVDYYADGPYAYQYYRFRWYIERGNLVLEYPYDPDLNTTIYDYQMTGSRFTGRFSGGSTFYLRKVADYYDWNGYTSDFGYGWNSGWNDDYYPYAYGTRSAGADSLSAGTAKRAADVSGRVTRRGSRFVQ